MAENLVVGQTEPVEQQLTRNGVAENLTGATVELILWRGAVTINTAADVTAYDVALGKVRYTPDWDDLTPGVYQARWKVTKGSSIGFFPDGPADIWTVRV